MPANNKKENSYMLPRFAHTPAELYKSQLKS